MKSATSAELSLIPRPASIAVGEGRFTLTNKTRIQLLGATPQTRFAAHWLAGKLRLPTGLPIPVTELAGTAPGRDAIVLSLDPAARDVADKNVRPPLQADRIVRHPLTCPPLLADESYTLDVTPERVTLRAPAAAGLFHGTQTLRQLLPAAIERNVPAPDIAEWTIPCVKIADQPRYPWRGFMLDPGRHHQTVEFTKRYLDLMAYLKMNILHWHLTEDQGWRIEIERYPKLTQVGAYVQEGEQRWGFFTKDQAREIVAYAAERHIMVIPEIEIPGHSFAAMMSYPELCCTGRPARNPGHTRDLYCAGNEATFEFLENVLSEIVELFPAPYVHIGGDEAPKERWKACPKCQARIKAEGLKDEEELQSYVNHRIARFLAGKGRRIIGWEEILDGAIRPNLAEAARLPQDAIVHWWRNRTSGAKYAIDAARSGRDVFCSPNNRCYLSFPISPNETHKMERTIDLREAYEFEDTPDGLTPDELRHILGVEACMWGEWDLQDQVDVKVFPRVLAIAERQWSPREGKKFDEFHQRVQRHYARLDAMGVKHGPEFRGQRAQFSGSPSAFIFGQPSRKPART